MVAAGLVLLAVGIVVTVVLVNANLHSQLRHVQQDNTKLAAQNQVLLRTNTVAEGQAKAIRRVRTKLVDEDARTQRLVCFLLHDVLHNGASISIDSQGHDMDDCAGRNSLPLIPERNRKPGVPTP
jgi:hypothetical protein